MSKYSIDKIRSRNKVVGDSPVDPSTGHVIIIPFEEHEVRQGNMWAFSRIMDDVASGECLYVQINVGEKPVHLHSVRMWTDSPKARVDLFVGITAIVDGDEEIPIAQVNQTVEAVVLPEGLKLYSNPTEIAADPNHSQFFGAGGGVSVTANSDQLALDTPLIMRPGQKNLICITSLDTIDRSVSINGLLHVEDR